MRDPAALTSDELIALVEDARWFAAKGRALESAEVVGVPVREGLVTLAIVEVRFAAGTHEHYLVADCHSVRIACASLSRLSAIRG